MDAGCSKYQFVVFQLQASHSFPFFGLLELESCKYFLLAPLAPMFGLVYRGHWRPTAGGRCFLSTFLLWAQLFVHSVIVVALIHGHVLHFRSGLWFPAHQPGISSWGTGSGEYNPVNFAPIHWPHPHCPGVFETEP